MRSDCKYAIEFETCCIAGEGVGRIGCVASGTYVLRRHPGWNGFVSPRPATETLNAEKAEKEKFLLSCINNVESLVAATCDSTQTWLSMCDVTAHARWRVARTCTSICHSVGFPFPSAVKQNIRQTGAVAVLCVVENS